MNPLTPWLERWRRCCALLGAATFDRSFLMRNITHEWRADGQRREQELWN
jgi:hypothetical protein